MYIRLPTIARLALPAQHLGAQHILAYRPTFFLAIHRQQIPLMQRYIPDWLLRSKKLQVFPSFYNSAVVPVLCVAEGCLRDGRERAVCECESRERTVSGAYQAEQKSVLVKGVL